jgi:signal peptidase II
MSDPRWRAYAAAAALVAIDRATKLAIQARVSLSDEYTVIPGFFNIVHSENRGVAFSFFDRAEGWGAALLILLPLAAVLFLAAALYRPERLDRETLAGFTLILGGAAGNLWDRIAAGRVTDFLLFYIGRYQWPAFNVADSAIVIGSGLLILGLLRPKRQAARVP